MAVTQPGRSFWRRVRALLALGASLGMLATPEAGTPALPQRLVVGLDGVGFGDVQAAQTAGAFARFHPVSRLVSTFPSISDIAWSEIYRTPPPQGYQRVYFKLDANKKVGSPIDPIRPIEFELRMHLGFVQMTHHLSAYLSPSRTARGELSTLSQTFFASRGVETYFAYLPAPDAMQHVRGDVRKYLSALDRELTSLLRTYRERTGRELELVVMSDHGNNQRLDGQTVGIGQFLENHGYHSADDLSSAREVAFSTDGVTTGLGVFVRASDVQPLALALSALRGVEFVTAVAPAVGDEVRVTLLDSFGGTALIRRRPNGHLAYVPGVGDPLKHASLAARLKAEGRMDIDGFASEAAWFEVSREHQFPAALDRIVRGHYDVTSNPAPILVSIKDGYQVASGMVSFFNQLRPLGGTHGGLNAVNSLGMVMSTFRPTVDASTHTVAEQFDGFQPLAPLRRSSSRPR